MSGIRLCRDDDAETILAIINMAAVAYRGVIPADRWQEPYMSAGELEAEVEAGVTFWGYDSDGGLVGVMGIQTVRDVVLIRHAYVRPDQQRRGIGAALLGKLEGLSARPLLVGTWAAADWAIRFYRRHGFELVPDDRRTALLATYWTIPEAQIAASVVLAKQPVAKAVAPAAD